VDCQPAYMGVAMWLSLWPVWIDQASVPYHHVPGLKPGSAWAVEGMGGGRRIAVAYLRGLGLVHSHLFGQTEVPRQPSLPSVPDCKTTYSRISHYIYMLTRTF